MNLNAYYLNRKEVYVQIENRRANKVILSSGYFCFKGNGKLKSEKKKKEEKSETYTCSGCGISWDRKENPKDKGIGPWMLTGLLIICWPWHCGIREPQHRTLPGTLCNCLSRDYPEPHSPLYTPSCFLASHFLSFYFGSTTLISFLILNMI